MLNAGSERNLEQHNERLYGVYYVLLVPESCVYIIQSLDTEMALLHHLTYISQQSLYKL